jgi:hypothetical protein
MNVFLVAVFVSVFLFNATRLMIRNNKILRAAYFKFCEFLQGREVEVLTEDAFGKDIFIYNCKKLTVLLESHPGLLREIRMVKKDWWRGAVIVIFSAFGAVIASAVAIHWLK